MSYIVSAACVRLKCPGVAKNVLMQLADIANDHGCAWPSIETICMRTDWGRTAVIDAINWLEQHGAIKADRTNGRKTLYRITPDKFDGERHKEQLPDRYASRTGTPGGPVRQTDPTGTPGGLNRSAKRTLITKNHQEPSGTPLPPKGGERVENTGTGDPDGGWPAFWSIWPKKVDESNARRAWNRLAPDAALQGEIAQAIHAWTRSPEWRADNGRWIPKASKWLRGQRWRDVPGLAAPPPPPAPTRAPEPPLTLEQRRANKLRAQEVAALARQVLGAAGRAVRSAA